jgi:hypothetical protein
MLVVAEILDSASLEAVMAMIFLFRIANAWSSRTVPVGTTGRIHFA